MVYKKLKVAMIDKINYCYKCSFFDRYYTKGTKRFDKTRFGKCRKKNEIVDALDSCDECRIVNFNYCSKRAVRRCLNDILIQLTELRQIVEEENDVID